MGSPETTSPAAAPVAQSLGPGTLKFGSVGSEMEFSSRVLKVEYSPELKKDSPVEMLDGSVHQPEGTWEGKLSGEFYQEYGSTSLINWCLKHAGELLPFEFRPRNNSPMIFKGMCTILPVKVGGDPKKENTTSFDFECVGKPEITER